MILHFNYFIYIYIFIYLFVYVLFVYLFIYLFIYFTIEDEHFPISKESFNLQFLSPCPMGFISSCGRIFLKGLERYIITFMANDKTDHVTMFTLFLSLAVLV